MQTFLYYFSALFLRTKKKVQTFLSSALFLICHFPYKSVLKNANFFGNKQFF